MLNQWRSKALKRLTTISSSCSSSRTFHTIQAIPREVTGARVSARDRFQGRIPAVVLAPHSLRPDAARPESRKHLVTAERKQIAAILNEVEAEFFCSTRFPLQIRAGSGSSVLIESGNVLPIKIHRDEKTGKVLNLVFVWADEGSTLKVDIPIVFKGEDVCPGLKKGGSLNKIRTALKYLCPTEHIPSKIEVDISKLDIGDKVYMKDITVHSSLKLLSKDETIPICKVGVTKLVVPDTVPVEMDPIS